jgi:hypothetical protein
VDYTSETVRVIRCKNPPRKKCIQTARIFYRPHPNFDVGFRRWRETTRDVGGRFRVCVGSRLFILTPLRPAPTPVIQVTYDLTKAF